MKKDIAQLNNLSDRLNYVLSLTGTKKADLARAINVKPQVIQFLCDSTTKASRFTFEIATAMGLNTRWLATGEGEMFVADDPKQQFFKNYSRVPLLNSDALRQVFINDQLLNEYKANSWLPLKTTEDDVFAITMTDTSMDPFIPAESTVFIKRIYGSQDLSCKYLFAYLEKFDTFVIRERCTIMPDVFLTPKNLDLFKEIKLDSTVRIIGIVTDCLWHLRS